MTTTYYAIFTHNDEIPPAQKKKHGTPAYGFKTLNRAMYYCPEGGYVQERHVDKFNDWGGDIWVKGI